MDLKIRCHQFLGGRFHEGYGRTEISREDDHGRKKRTIDYEGINLEGRDSFFYDGYRAYEIEPTHSDWKYPGVFCITNATENGSQAARTYGLIPASGSIEDALSVLRGEPNLSLEEFSEYDLGRKNLTWLDVERTSVSAKKYVLTEAAQERLGEFLSAYWSIMSIRMMDPDNRVVVALHLSFNTMEPEKLFQEQVDFFRQEVVARFPKAVQTMTSVAFGVPWTQRRMHPATACIVTSEEKDLNANPIFSFEISYVNGQYEVDAGRTYRGYETAEQENVVLSAVLEGRRAIPRIYRNLEDVFNKAEYGGDHIILRSHEVMALLAQIDLRNDRWNELTDTKKRNEARKYALADKRNYDILYKTLLQNCKCSEEDTYQALLPLLDDLLDAMGSIDEGTEFENVFSSADLPFFAGCRRLNETVAAQTSEGGRRSEKLNRYLVENYSQWSELQFRCDLGKGKEDDDIVLPKAVFLMVSGTALIDNKKIGEVEIDRTRKYCQQHFPEETVAIARSIFEWQGNHLSVDRAFYENQRAWLTDNGIRDDKKSCILLLSLADKLLEDDAAMEKAGVEFVGEHMEQLIMMMDELNGRERETAEKMVARESDFLLENFAKWRQAQYDSGMTQRKGSNMLESMVEKWQKENMARSNLGSAELTNILNSLVNVKNEQGTKLDLTALKRHILFVEMEESLRSCESDCTREKIQNLAGCFQKTRGTEEGSERYQNVHQDTIKILCQHFALWSEAEFQMGDQDPDSGLVEIAREWRNLIQRDRGGAIGSSEVKGIAKKLAEQYSFKSTEGKELLEQIEDCCFNMMLGEAARDKDAVDADPAWWERLEEFYEAEWGENENRRDKIARLINEGCGRDNPHAKRVMNEILQKNHNSLPQGVSRQSRWNDARRARLNDAVRNMLSRFKAPEDLTEDKLSNIWEDEYREDYSSAWQELRSQSDFANTVNGYLGELYRDTNAEERIALLRALWKTAESGSAESTNGLPKDEQNFVLDTLTRDYNELWKSQNMTGRENLDAFAEMVQQKRGLELGKTAAGAAKAFLKGYAQENPMDLNEIGRRIKELARKPEWRSWVNWREVENEDSAVLKACRQHEVSEKGIGMRLIHDLAVDTDGGRGAYWSNVTFDVLGMTGSEIKGVKMESPNSGKVLNGLSWLSHVAEVLDDAGAGSAMTDLGQWLQNCAPEMMNDLRDEKKRESMWVNWHEIFPEHLLKMLDVKN